MLSNSFNSNLVLRLTKVPHQLKGKFRKETVTINLD
jgi:hypothetical protein